MRASTPSGGHDDSRLLPRRSATALRQELLREALTHRSHSTPHNERLGIPRRQRPQLRHRGRTLSSAFRLARRRSFRLRANLVRQDSLAIAWRWSWAGASCSLGRASGGQAVPAVDPGRRAGSLSAPSLSMPVSTRPAWSLRHSTPPGSTEPDPPRPATKDAKTRAAGMAPGPSAACPPKYTHVLATAGRPTARQFEVACRSTPAGIRAVGTGAAAVWRADGAETPPNNRGALHEPIRSGYRRHRRPPQRRQVDACSTAWSGGRSASPRARPRPPATASRHRHAPTPSTSSSIRRASRPARTTPQPGHEPGRHPDPGRRGCGPLRHRGRALRRQRPDLSSSCCRCQDRPVILVVNKTDRLKDKAACPSSMPALPPSGTSPPWCRSVPSRPADRRSLAEARKPLPGAARSSTTTRSPTASRTFPRRRIHPRKLFRPWATNCPTGTTVEIEKFEVEGNLRRIHAAVIVDRDGHKAIVIGKGGESQSASPARPARTWSGFSTARSISRSGSRSNRGWADDERAVEKPGYE